jgi:branched-chain amino acid transport system substrate-binding protein
MKNRMVKGKRVGIIVLAAALTVALLLTSCAPGPTAGEKIVKVAASYPMTGPGSSSMQLQEGGIEDYFRYFNEQEVIPGVHIQLSWADDMMSVTQILSNYARFVEQGMPLIFMEQHGAVIGLKERAEKDQVVLFVAASGYQEVNYPEPGWRYAVTPTIAEQAAALAEYFMENWQEERAPRLAFIGMDSPWGREPEYATGYCQGLGFEVLPLELTPFVTLDATTILLRLREGGADLVYIQALPPAVGPILRDAERLGIVGQMTFAGHASGMGERVIQMAGVASEGYLIPRQFPWFTEPEIPGIKLMLDTQMKYHGKEMREGEVFFGWVAAPVVCEAIRRAIENVGYENVDGAAIKEALDSIKDFDVYGLATVTYKPDDHRGVTKVAIHRIEDGKIVRVTDWQDVPIVGSEG